MHNHYLLDTLNGKMNIGLISSKININETYYLKKKIEFNGISNYLPLFFWRLIKNKSLQNGLRSFQDWQISKEMARNLDYHSADVILEAFCILALGFSGLPAFSFFDISVRILLSILSRLA